MAKHGGPLRLPRPIELLACLVASATIAFVILAGLVAGLSMVGRLPLFPG